MTALLSKGTAEIHALSVEALLEQFEKILYDIPEDRRELAFALFKSSLAVAMHGKEAGIGKAFAQRAIEWNSKRRTKNSHAVSDMEIFQKVNRLRAQAKQKGKPVPPLTRLVKSNRPTAFRILRQGHRVRRLHDRGRISGTRFFASLNPEQKYAELGARNARNE